MIVSRAVPIVAALAAAMALAIGVAVVVLLKPAQATFPGVPGKIAYVGGDEIHTIWPDGGGDRQITTDTPVGARAPAYSPDGSRIAYVSYDRSPGHELDYEVFTMTADGGNMRQISETETDTGASSPAYSPDGSRIAYSSDDFSPTLEFDSEIYTVKAGDGSGTLQLTHNTKYDYSPSYSPDGRRIAYVSHDGNTSEIYTIKVGGGDKRRVTNNTRREDDPDYSPGGWRIAYSSYDGNDSEIYTIRIDGQDRRQVTNNSTRDVSPSWGSR